MADPLAGAGADGGATSQIVETGEGVFLVAADGTRTYIGPPRVSQSVSSSSSVSQSYQDPRALELQAQQLSDQRRIAEQQAVLAQRQQNWTEAAYWQTRADNLKQAQDDLAYRYATLRSGETQGELNRTATARENEATRTYQRGESALDRAARASEFAATYGLQQDQAALARQQAVAQWEDAQNARRLDASRTLADVISNIDPGAVAAFSQAGGGVLSNAIARGSTALTDRAMLPAARTWQTIDQLNAQRNPYFALGAPQQQGGISFGEGGYSPEEAAAIQARIRNDFTGMVGSAAQGNPSTFRTTGADVDALHAAGIQTLGDLAGQFGGGGNAVTGTAGNGTFTLSAAPGSPGVTQGYQGATGETRYAYGTIPRYAFGTPGEPARGTFITGDSTDPADPFAAGARPERITLNDPPGPNNAEAQVEPLAPFDAPSSDRALVGDVLSAVGALLKRGEGTGSIGGMDAPPRYAFGTVDPQAAATGGDPFGLVTEADQPYLDRVRTLREGIDTTAPVQGGYFNAGFGMLAPTIQRRYLAALQSRYGAAAEDFAAEANRFRVPTASRGALSFGY